MCDYNNLTTQEKEGYCKILNEYAYKLGGKAIFWQLLEVVRERDPCPLISNRCKMSFVRGYTIGTK